MGNFLYSISTSTLNDIRNGGSKPKNKPSFVPTMLGIEGYGKGMPNP